MNWFAFLEDLFSTSADNRLEGSKIGKTTPDKRLLLWLM
jgi:hypothetical protein